MDNSLMDRIVSIEKGSDTDKSLNLYLEKEEDKRCLYSDLDFGCLDYRLISIRTEEEYIFFIRNIFKTDQKMVDDETLKNMRVRLVDKNSPLGELEIAQLKNAESRAGDDFSKVYKIEEDDYFIRISSFIDGTSDVLSEIILFSKLKEEDRKRLIERSMRKHNKESDKDRKAKGMAPRR